MGYVLVEDIFDEMSQNITYIKLNSYLKRKVNSQTFLLSLFGI